MRFVPVPVPKSPPRILTVLPEKGVALAGTSGVCTDAGAATEACLFNGQGVKQDKLSLIFQSCSSDMFSVGIFVELILFTSLAGAALAPASQVVRSTYTLWREMIRSTINIRPVERKIKINFLSFKVSPLECGRAQDVSCARSCSSFLHSKEGCCKKR